MTGGLLLVLAAWLPSSATADTHLLVISGLGGEDEYSDRFHDWSMSLISSAAAAGLPAADIHYLAEDPERAPDAIDGTSRRDTIVEHLQGLRGRLGSEDELWVTLFGHGSGRGDLAKLSLPGPDMDAADFAEVLEGFEVARLVLVNTASASGEFVEALSGPNRLIVTATRSASEHHAPVFGGFFVAGFEGLGADTDKDERVSLLEAFSYARQEVQRRFDSEQLLLTEHALLDDNGDQEGSLEPALAEDVDGLAASRAFLAPPVGIDPSQYGSPEVRGLARRKEGLEGRVAELRAQREAMDEETYLEELEALLLELARASEALRSANGEAAEEGA
ncbi:MAG: hypothetical protein VYE73_17910 [Acidobacteriota bacterium]|nr:hypothetical protein [Acidobacteriota bacterium]